MKLFTTSQHKRLLLNGQKQAAVKGTDKEFDFKPVVKLFTPDANATWLLTEIDPDAPHIAFGLCDLGQGYPELGNVDLRELSQLCGQLGLPVERDRYFEADKTLSAYTDLAIKSGQIMA